MFLHLLTEKVFTTTLQSRYGRAYNLHFKINKMRFRKCGIYTYKRILFTLKKKKEILLFATMWMNLENIKLNEISETQKDKYCMIILVFGI